MATFTSDGRARRLRARAETEAERRCVARILTGPGAAMARNRETEGSEPGVVHATLSRMRWEVVLPLAAALALGLGVIQLIGMMLRPLALLIVAITLAESLAPVVGWVEERIHRRTLAVTVVYLAIVAVLVGLGWFVAPALVDQGQELVQRAPSLIGDVQERLSRIGLLSQQDMAGFAGSMQGRLGDLVIAAPTMIMGAAIDVLVVIFLSIYWLITARAIRDFTLSLVPDRHRRKTRQVLHRMGQTMGGYVRGAVINAVIMGILAYVGLLLIGVRYPLALGVLTMLGEVVPFIGPIVVGVIVALIALLQSLTKAVIAILLYTGLEQVEGHLLTPNIMRSQTDVPQTLVLFAIIVGGGVGGILGILVAIPSAAAVRVFVLEVVAPKEREAVDASPDVDAAAEAR